MYIFTYQTHTDRQKKNVSEQTTEYFLYIDLDRKSKEREEGEGEREKGG